MTDVSESYRWCRNICRTSRSSFVPAFALVDTERRRAMYALYAFARISDDLADDPVTLRSHESSGYVFSTTQRRQRLTDWQNQLHENVPVKEEWNSVHSQRTAPPETDLPKTNTQHPEDTDRFSMLWPALADSVSRFEIPIRLLDEIIAGVGRDIEPQQPKDWPELRDYCYHVASAVGIACTHIWGRAEACDKQPAIECGIAFQLTNILRDVAEDSRSNRIYLPTQLFEQFDVDREEWLQGKPSGRWQEMMQHVAHQAFEAYQTGWKTIEGLEPRSQRMFSLMWRSYHSLLEKVVAEIPATWHQGKTRLSLAKKTSLFATHYFHPLYVRLPKDGATCG